MSSPKERVFAYLEKNGIPIVSPDNPCWDRIPITLVDTILENEPEEKWNLKIVQRMAIAAGPIVATIYNEATVKHIELTSLIPGDVIHHPEVIQALENYVLSENTHPNFDDAVEGVLKALIEAHPLRLPFCKMLQDKYYVLKSDQDMRAWIAPYIGGIPPFKTWEELCDIVSTSCPLTADDRDMKAPQYIKKGHTYHWSTNVQRMDLVLASWLYELNLFSTNLKSYDDMADNVYMALYSHLPSIQMNNPDELTTVFWTYLHEYIQEPDINTKLKGLLEEWMNTYPQYHAFIKKHYDIVANVVEGDSLLVGHHLNNLYQELYPTHTFRVADPASFDCVSIGIHDSVMEKLLF